MNFRSISHVIFFLFFATQCLALDTPQFYRTPLFQGETKRNISDWTTHIDFQYAQGSTYESWNCHEKKTHLFNAFGPFDLKRLTENMEDLDNYPLSKAYANGDIPKLSCGKMAFKGNFSLDEYNITFQQNLMWGLYLQAYIPIRKAKIDCIRYTRSLTTKSEYNTLASFIDNDLDAILNEHGIKPLKKPFNKTAIADPVISLGWQGSCTFPDNIISALRGSLQGGIIIPYADRKPNDHVFSIPLGYNKHWGFSSRINLHATLWEKIVIGSSAGSSIFLNESYCQRLTTSPCQNGWIVLEHRSATVNQGSIWDASGYIKGERIFGGLSIFAGYSFTQKEHTTLDVEDPCFLKTALEEDLVHNKNEVADSNKLLKSWYQHALHFYAEYDLGAHDEKKLTPTIRIAYDYPLSGRYSWATAMTSGTASLIFNWCL